jgi:hypothetical protein
MARKDVTRESINMEWDEAFITSYYRAMDLKHKPPQVIDWDAVKPFSKRGYAPKDAAEKYIRLKGE